MTIPKERLGYEENDRVQVTLLGTIKPDLANVTYAEDDELHVGEIMVIQVDVEDILQDIYPFLLPIFKAIKYQCLVVLKYLEKFKLAVCKVRPGKVNPDLNIPNYIIASYWIHTDLMSAPVEKAISDIRTALNDSTDLKTIYERIHSAVVSIEQRGMSEAHAKKIVMGVMGRQYPKGIKFKEILKYCTPIQYHKPKPGPRRKHAPVERESNYILLHDYEDIWYCLQRSEQTQRYVSGESDMQTLIYRLEKEPRY